MKEFEYIEYGEYTELGSDEVVTYTTVSKFDQCKIHYEYGLKYLAYGQLHREDGPAIIIFRNGINSEIRKAHYWLNSIEYPKDEWFQKISKENRMKYLFNIADYEVSNED